MKFTLSTTEMEVLATNAKTMSPAEACWAAVKNKEQQTVFNSVRTGLGKALTTAGNAVQTQPNTL